MKTITMGKFTVVNKDKGAELVCNTYLEAKAVMAHVGRYQKNAMFGTVVLNSDNKEVAKWHKTNYGAEYIEETKLAIG